MSFDYVCLFLLFAACFVVFVWCELINNYLFKRKEKKIMAKKTKKETKEVTRIVKLEITAIEKMSIDEELKTEEEVLEVLKRKLKGMVDDVKILNMKTFEHER